MNSRKVIASFIVLILLLQFKFFWLVPFNGFYALNANQQQILMLVIIVLGLIIFKLTPILGDNSLLGKLILFFIVIYLVELLLSAMKNGQGFVNAFISSNYYLVILLYFLGSYFVNTYDHNMSYVFKYIVVLTFINSVVCWMQFLLYRFGIVFTRLNLSTARFGSMRIVEISDTVACFGILICFAGLLSGKRKGRMFSIIVIFLGISGTLLVGKGRITILAVTLAVICMVLWRFRKNAVKILGLLLLMSVIAVSALRSDLGQSYLNSFNDNSTDTYSIRQDEMRYYNAQTRDALIFGTGFIRDMGDYKTAEMRGPQNSYSRTDIGIFGTANIFGITGVIWYFSVLLVVIKQIFGALRHRNDQMSLAALGMLVMCIAYIPTMIMFNPFSITAFALLLIISNRLSEQERYIAEYSRTN